MYLFIFESLGTSELILIGIVALVFLGPRKLPEYARKIGKMMAEFRGTANEFKETWQREVNFEEEAKALDLGNLDSESSATPDQDKDPVVPSIRSVDPAEFEGMIPDGGPSSEREANGPPTETPANDKKNWL